MKLGEYWKSTAFPGRKIHPGVQSHGVWVKGGVSKFAPPRPASSPRVGALCLIGGPLYPKAAGRAAERGKRETLQFHALERWEERQKRKLFVNYGENP